jgi:hypothetical protein
MRPIAIAVSTTAARCKRFPGSPRDCPETVIKHNDQLESEQPLDAGQDHAGLLQHLLDFCLEGLALFLSTIPRPGWSIRAASPAPLTALHVNGTESAHASGILGATRFLSAVRVLSIGAPARSWLSALVKRQ